MGKMKNLLDQNRLVLYLLIIILAFTAVCLAQQEPKVSIKAVKEQNLTEAEKLARENSLLRNRLAKLEPSSPVKIVTEDKPSPAAEAFPVLTVMNEGISVPFEVIYEDMAWVRPDYQPYWHSKQGQWSSIPDRIHTSYHHLFVVPGNEDLWNETAHDVGFAELADKIKLPVYDDKPENTLAVVALQHQITGAYVLNNQVILVGAPARTGIQVLSFNKQDLVKSESGEILARNNSLKFLFQLVTPDGYETDYSNVMVSY